MTSAGDRQRIGSIGLVACAAFFSLLEPNGRSIAAEPAAAAHFHERVKPILESYCYGCHANGERKGGHEAKALWRQGEGAWMTDGLPSGSRAA